VKPTATLKTLILGVTRSDEGRAESKIVEKASETTGAQAQPKNNRPTDEHRAQGWQYTHISAAAFTWKASNACEDLREAG
jgi:hypothetical protein